MKVKEITESISNQLKNIARQQNLDYNTLVKNFSKDANLPPGELITDLDWEEYYQGLSLLQIKNIEEK